MTENGYKAGNKDGTVLEKSSAEPAGICPGCGESYLQTSKAYSARMKTAISCLVKNKMDSSLPQKMLLSFIKTDP